MLVFSLSIFQNPFSCTSPNRVEQLQLHPQCRHEGCITCSWQESKHVKFLKRQCMLCQLIDFVFAVLLIFIMFCFEKYIFIIIYVIIIILLLSTQRASLVNFPVSTLHAKLSQLTDACSFSITDRSKFFISARKQTKI